MPETPTPGESAYAAYVTAIERRPQPASVIVAMWARLKPSEHRIWEAVAQAVLALKEERAAPLPEDCMTLINEAKPFFEDAFAGVLERIEIRPHDGLLRVVARVASDDLPRLNRCLRAFDEAWWLANCHRSTGQLVFDYETVSRSEEAPHA